MSLTRLFGRKRIEPCLGGGKPSHSNETTPSSNRPDFPRMEACPLASKWVVISLDTEFRGMGTGYRMSNNQF